MDLVCIRCGEPWDLDEVLHESPNDFRRAGALIGWCPACPTQEPAHHAAEKERLARIATLAVVLGDDVDAVAAEIADNGLL